MFRPFNSSDDSLIVRATDTTLNASKKHMETLFHNIAHVMELDVHVIYQRAFQLGCITYQPYSHFLLSHRPDGWRSDEIDYLISNAHKPRKVIARELERTMSSVAKQIFEFRLGHGGHEYPWREDEIAMLKRYTSQFDFRSLVYRLQRSPIDVKHQALHLGIKIIGTTFLPYREREKRTFETTSWSVSAC